MTMSLLDSHVHVVDLSRPEGVAWPAADSPLYRSASVGDLAALYSGDGLSGCIVVETSRRDVDDNWLVALASTDSRVRGVVLNLRPDEPGFAGRLDRALLSDRFVGIRLRPIADYDLSSPRLISSLARVADAGKTVEFGAPTVEQKRQFAALAERLPELRLILDHGGHPPAQDDAIKEWQDGIRQIAASDNAVCKVTCGDRRVFESLLSAFGANRLLYGSNWPVSGFSAVTMAQRLEELRDFAGHDAPAFFSANAECVYGLITAAAGGISRESR